MVTPATTHVNPYHLEDEILKSFLGRFSLTLYSLRIHPHLRVSLPSSFGSAAAVLLLQIDHDTHAEDGEDDEEQPSCKKARRGKK